MGKSTASCFKIITCGTDSVDHDDVQKSETKGLSDRRRWSFRKKSPKHKVLSNSVISEAPSNAKNKIPESTAVNFQTQPNLTNPEKTTLIQCTEEKNVSSSQTNSNLSDSIAANEDDPRADSILEESSAIVIQTAIRGCLAQNELSKQRSLIKLQAVVRGYLVRRHAVGTLRCVQAIVKMQALVRARQARLRIQGSGDDFEKQCKSTNVVDNPPPNRSKREAKPNDSTHTYISIEKLLSNRFARQLVETSPRTKPINISCDPSKSESAWKWLDRWMSASSQTQSNKELHETESTAEKCENESPSHSEGKSDISVPSECHPELTNVKSAIIASDEASESDDNLISRDLKLKVEAKSPPHEEETGNEMNTPDLENFSSDQPETDAEEFSRKASNTTLADQPFNSNALSVQIGDFECGTRLSISSTLDSPDRPEFGVNGSEGALEKKPEVDPISLQLELGHHSSPEASPRSHITIPESQATPSSQVSSKPKKSTAEKNESNRKNKSSLNHNQDSASRSSLDHKSGKRRNSSGSTNSSSINSLPSYMQATESARAKAITSASPRSSPDGQDKDILYIKRRHSHSPQDGKWRR